MAVVQGEYVHCAMIGCQITTATMLPSSILTGTSFSLAMHWMIDNRGSHFSLRLACINEKYKIMWWFTVSRWTQTSAKREFYLILTLTLCLIEMLVRTQLNSMWVHRLKAFSAHTHTLMMMFECSLQQPNDVRKTLNSLSDSDFKMCSLHVFLSSWLLGMAPVWHATLRWDPVCLFVWLEWFLFFGKSFIFAEYRMRKTGKHIILLRRLVAFPVQHFETFSESNLYCSFQSLFVDASNNQWPHWHVAHCSYRISI